MPVARPDKTRKNQVLALSTKGLLHLPTLYTNPARVIMITKVANQGREVRIDALQADFGKYHRERSENSGRAQQNQSYVIVLGVISMRIRESKQKTQDCVVITARI